MSERPPALTLYRDLHEADVQPFVCGVYFLCTEREVVYIGRSVNVFARIAAHEHTGKFDRVFFQPVPKDQLDETEGRLIREFRPPLNIHGRRSIRAKRSPMINNIPVASQLAWRLPIAAAAYGFEEASLRKAFQQGRLKATKMGDGPRSPVIVTREAMDEYVASYAAKEAS